MRTAFFPDQLKFNFEKFQKEQAMIKSEKTGQSRSLRQKRLEPISSFSVQAGEEAEAGK
jgi:hypothetical protein